MSTASTACDACAVANRAGYCAPLRCYCGHSSCSAYASYARAASPIRGFAKAGKTHQAHSAWDTREEETWIDQL